MPTPKQLELMANKLRVHSLKMTTAAGSGHATSCLSCAEIMSCLFFSELQKEDEFILSKGHAAPILWASYAEAGLISVNSLDKLRQINSNLEGHPTASNPLIKIATGSLGQGLSAGVGMALAKRLLDSKGRIYVLMGDGETAEGSVWEAVNSAVYYKLNNLCAIIDVNRLGQSQETMHGHHIEEYKRKFEAFGWNVLVSDGHDANSILDSLAKAKKNSKPTAIIAKTIKGKGVSFLENKEGWHGVALNPQALERALREIGRTNIELKSKIKQTETKYPKIIEPKKGYYKKIDAVATRDAFGNALVKLGMKNSHIVVLDGDVKNSTRTEQFFKNFPNRSFESFIAEQNMIGMAMGISAMGFIPFAATFSAFLTRAYDFIRMAQYSKSNIKIIGSHSGVSIGQDGPSQMGLEDISLFLAMPNSTILYPSDAVSTEYLVKEMAKQNGIVYLRTTREKTPVLYDNDEKFHIGGLKVLRQSKKDKALVIAAGITVHEALKAYEILKKKGINIRIIDLYSVKPIDKNQILANAKACKNNVIVVEDHYFNGIGSVVRQIVGKIKHLYVKEIPHSGTPSELMRKYGIDAESIVKQVP